MKKYEDLEFEVINFTSSDVILTSPPRTDDDTEQFERVVDDRFSF